MFQGFTIMSSPHLKPMTVGDTFRIPVESLAGFDASLPFVQTVDRSIDTALKSVPLPDGLMSRLSKLANTLSDEVSDPVDYLGC
jgi:hypothetical protein